MLLSAYTSTIYRSHCFDSGLKPLTIVFYNFFTIFASLIRRWALNSERALGDISNAINKKGISEIKF